MEQEKKTARRKYNWKPPIDRLDEVEDLIAKSGLSANAFFTSCILQKRRPSIPPSLTSATGQLLGFLAPIRDHLRRLETAPSDDEHHAILLQIRDLLIQIRSALFQILGRKP